ncbi:MAG TPA: DUF3293 domain-containing protein [Lysobacter sp.]|jgi:hypothetical protein|nr:DUF3293 domain-containing protein [Lysobacter sp.]
MRELQIVDAMELVAAYASAEYAVVLDGDALQLHVGAPASDLEAYWPAQQYAFITAWNPASIPHSDAANETANEALVARLDAMGLPRQPAHAYDRTGEWREAGWLVTDIDTCALDLLAREFGQAGVLAWRYGEPVRLRMLLPKPPHAEAGGQIDWVPQDCPDRMKPPAIA